MLSGDGGSGVDGIETVPPPPVVSDPELSVLVDRVESAVAELAEQASASWTNADRRAVIQRMETLTRSVTAYSYTWLNELIAQHGLDVYPGSVPSSVAWMLRITPRAAGARVRLAAELGDRTALSGEVLPPLLPHTAAALRAGLLDAKHVQMIREFFKHLPASVDPQTRDLAEQQLVGYASTRLPDDFAPLVAHLDSILNPDGDYGTRTRTGSPSHANDAMRSSISVSRVPTGCRKEASASTPDYAPTSRLCSRKLRNRE
ncbi:13E12 repeat family protein [Rhodococcus sp. 15-649-2-2]|uniref:13E12 repeat family protein n=1 Tax=Rhodococcus sp. 15-649-2-2 TaxID=2023140 RepID=UPI00211AF459|nr:13E12 repeat family protein [Rhodococcus sp. 15-649-2-2]